MTFKVVTATPSAAVATAGTITLSYPADTTAGDFATHGHYMVADGLQAKFSQDAGTMSVSFGASDITLTYSGSTSIPAGSRVTVNLNVRGLGVSAPPSLVDTKRMSHANIVRLELGAPDTADANGIVETQDLTSAGVYSVLAFNGVYGDTYANAYAILDVPRNVVAAWTTTAVLTVTGLDEYGDVIVESSASGTTMTGKKAFKRITAIATSANITALTVGTADVLGLPAYVGAVGQVVAEMQDNVMLSAFSPGKILIPFEFNEVDLLAPTAQPIVAPCAGYITGIRTIIVAAVTTGGAITVEANTVAVVGLSVTVADAATAGTTHSDTVLKIATGLVAAGDDITVSPGSAFATAGRVRGYLIFEPTAEMNGTFVAGVQTLPTATTGDVRGTYDPIEACNGSLQFALLVSLPEPNYRGVDNYDG